MTLDDMRTCDKAMLTPDDVSEVLGCNGYAINLQCKEDPRKLGFPVCVLGTRVKIPRVAFLRWLDGVGMFDEVQSSCSVAAR